MTQIWEFHIWNHITDQIGMFSNIGLMVAILLWRPQGLYPVGAK